LIFSPIDCPSRILDLGTGTGQWAIDGMLGEETLRRAPANHPPPAVGDSYPMAEVIGTDLSPIQPSWIPPNVKFIVDDLEDEWVVGGNFDLIHTRHLLPVLRNVDRLIATMWDNLLPGGWAEFQEFGGELCCDDGSLPADSALRRFFDLCAESVKEYGMSFRVANNLAGPLAALGFQNVRCQVFKTPIGVWPKVGGGKRGRSSECLRGLKSGSAAVVARQTWLT
jgi:SAM-dependent methyltransferase